MNFAQKLKTFRKQAGLSQDQLAEKLSVSRQAITKWETDNGLPDIENLIQIARMFKVSLDELVVYGTLKKTMEAYAYESETEYDIDAVTHYDINLGGAKKIAVGTNEKEKIRVRLASDTLADLETAFKVKIDESRYKLDVDIRHSGVYTEAQAKDGLFVFIELPSRIVHAELKATAAELHINGLSAETLEIDGKVSRIKTDGFAGNLELNSTIDMNIQCETFAGRLEVRQLFATSVLNLPKGTCYNVIKKGRGNRVSHTADNVPSAHENTVDALNVIEITGMQSELVINEYGSGQRTGGENE